METPRVEVHVEYRAPQAVTPYPHNAKTHPPEQINKLAAMIQAFGFDQPIVVDGEGVIIKGHGRRAAALQLGLEKVPVIVVTHLTTEQVRAARLADNNSADSPLDPEMLRFEIGALKELNFEMGLTGFEPHQIGQILVPQTSESQFGAGAHQSVKERKEAYEASEARQIMLVTTPEKFDALMRLFAAAQAQFQVETNIEVVEKLFEFHAQHQSNQNPSA